MKMNWKCLNYTEKEINNMEDNELKATLLMEWANCRMEEPPKQFGEFSAKVSVEMKKRGIDHKQYIG